MTITYTVRCQGETGSIISFDVTARDEATAWREVSRTLDLNPDDDLSHITITKAAIEDHPEGRERLHEDLITCPYCGHEDQDSWEFGGRQEEPLEVECGECMRPFVVTMYVEVTYTSKPKEAAR
jgi:hypothetical protein